MVLYMYASKNALEACRELMRDGKDCTLRLYSDKSSYTPEGHEDVYTNQPVYVQED